MKLYVALVHLLTTVLPIRDSKIGFYYWLEVQLAYFVDFAHITFPHSKRVVHSMELLFSWINLHFLFFYLVLYL